MSSGNATSSYRFSFGPWNISTGSDPFGPPVRRELEFARKIKAYKELCSPSPAGAGAAHATMQLSSSLFAI
jgi:hypothetical protein